MPGIDLVHNLRSALASRGLTVKMAARMSGRNADTLERVFQRRTRKLDAQMIAVLAHKIGAMRADPAESTRFIADVFGFAAPSAAAVPETLRAIHAHLERIERQREAAVPLAIWFDDTGKATAAGNGDLGAAVYKILDLPPGDEDIVAFACRNLGFIALSRDAAGVVRLRYEGEQVSRAALIGLRDWLQTNASEVRGVWRGPSAAVPQDGLIPGSETVHEAVAAIERRILAATPMLPRDWVVDPHRLDNLPPQFQPILRMFRQGASPVTAIANAGRMQNSNVYSVIDGEALALHIGGANNLPSVRYVGRRVLDRPTERDYAAMVDRHVVFARRTDAPTLHRLNVVIQNRRRDYWRLALPDPNSNVVVTTSWEPQAVES
jgi:hypothetical protein